MSKGSSCNSSKISALARELEKDLKAGKKPSSSKQNIQTIISSLSDERGYIRRILTQALGAIGQKAVPDLKKQLLSNSNVFIRRSAAKALKLTGDPSALPELLEALLNDEDPVVQGSAAAAMAIFGDKAVEHLLKVFTNSESTSTQRGFASWGLSFIGSEATEVLKEAAKSKNSSIRAAAITALGDQIQDLKNKSAKKILLKSLNDPSFEVRAEATTLLGDIEDPKWAAPYLRNQLNDESKQVRIKASLAIMKLKLRNEIGLLKNKLNTEEDIEVIKIFNLAINKLSKMI
tara:strand:- start:2444 stop:3313 length:870 start_codon:yes stop_codon:yes gene_type:complete